jgi:hypothetical protein
LGAVEDFADVSEISATFFIAEKGARRVISLFRARKREMTRLAPFSAMVIQRDACISSSHELVPRSQRHGEHYDSNASLVSTEQS